MSGGSKAQAGYQPTGQKQADVSYQNLINTNLPFAQSLPGQIAPQAQGFAQNIVNNPYATQQQAGINAASQLGSGTIAPQTIAGSQALNAYSIGGLPYGQQILQTGFDPQNALYNRQYHQTIDQQNAINSMYGLGTSPYGAGVTGMTGANFNIDWQNQQLARQAQALQGYNAIGSGAGAGFTTAANLGNQGLGTMTTSATLPYQTYNTTQGANLGALNDYSSLVSGSFAPSQSMLGDLATYLGLGQSATGLQQNAAQINNQANASAWGGIGNLFGNVLGDLTSPFGSTSILGNAFG